MRRTFEYLTLVLATFGLALTACESGGVGDPCVPEDEYVPTFGGFSPGEVNVESRSFQCETRLCLVANFQGRVSCPYGSDQSSCKIPGSDQPLEPGTNVEPQLLERQTDRAVYCSCRCAGPDQNANYCECPSGFECRELISITPTEDSAQLKGSYCIKSGTFVDDPRSLIGSNALCTQPNCGTDNPYGP